MERPIMTAPSVEMRSDLCLAGTAREAAEQFLCSIDSFNTFRAYRIAILRTVEWVENNGSADTEGTNRLLASVTPEEIGQAMVSLWSAARSSTWNARRAAVLCWLSWCRERGWTAPTMPADLSRVKPAPEPVTVLSRVAIESLTAREAIHLREKTLWWMIFETCARPRELLQADIEHLDLVERSCRVRSRRSGNGSGRPVEATLRWGPMTDQLLPRLLRDRSQGPVFVTHRRPRAGKFVGCGDLCPDTGLARLSYDQARYLLDSVTAVDGLGTGWRLHHLRDSGLAHLAASGIDVGELMSKARHRRPGQLRRYVMPSESKLLDL
ncbi:tyrosine-type recombinase/integrase [Nocardia tengchongensis]|uniref:tyrosine-type recombinase/integrase n=1 Tax=Nocardia tengchongensis TaxID=2055889 RepID=UPI0036C302CF